VDVRAAWSNEPLVFTPWLAEPDNLSYYIGVPLGLDLELVALEKRVGPFSADIVCRDKRSASLVVIENQLEQTDHRHLGQLFTYAAGLPASTVIWISSRFCPEHAAALRLLNELNPEKLRAFGLQVEVLRIADSPPAPKFTTVVAPTHWSSVVSTAANESAKTHSECSARRYEYWKTFLAGLILETQVDRIPSPNTLGNLRFNLKGRDLWITVYSAASLGRMGRIGVFVRGSAAFGEMFLQQRESIAGQIGEGLAWTTGEQWTIVMATDADPADKADWPRQHKWLAGHLNRFLCTFQPYASLNLRKPVRLDAYSSAADD
jgi:hypothetical protein